MTTILRASLAVVFATGLVGGTTACRHEEGPMQHAGEKMDKAGDKISDTVNPKGPAEKLGRDIDRATDKDD